MTNPNNPIELENQFIEGLNQEGKSADPELINIAVCIFLKTKPVDWSNLYLQGGRQWSRRGFSYLYLVTESTESELDPLLELVRIDKQIGWYGGNLEQTFFLHKALKIIDNEEVGNCHHRTKSLSSEFSSGISGVLSMIAVWFVSSIRNTSMNQRRRIQPSLPENWSWFFDHLSNF